MNTKLTWMANPSRTVSTYGCAFGMPVGSQVASRVWTGSPTTTVVREHTRALVLGAAAQDITKDAFPGTSAWRPPIC